MCLLHEVCSHLKLLKKEKTLKSKKIIKDPYDDYNELVLENAESGRVVEYYISKDINKIKFFFELYKITPIYYFLSDVYL